MYFSPRLNPVFKFFAWVILLVCWNVRNYMTSFTQHMNEVYNMFTSLCVTSHCIRASAVESTKCSIVISWCNNYYLHYSTNRLKLSFSWHNHLGQELMLIYKFSWQNEKKSHKIASSQWREFWMEVSTIAWRGHAIAQRSKGPLTVVWENPVRGISVKPKIIEM